MVEWELVLSLSLEDPEQGSTKSLTGMRRAVQM
jgi:hypothetical protein